MTWLATDRSLARRADPLRILPECRSILVLGSPYPLAGSLETPASPAPTGRIAAYACGEDYHTLLPARMNRLVEIIQSELGNPFPYLCYTDSGPILERDLAQRAGLGWIGRNTCLIHPRLGSNFLLAEILLGLELEPDPPFSADRCGTCSRCVDVCPTGCILPDRTLDSGRCISYLSIEHKSSIPVDLRSSMGNWIFGCDLCQLVCPWNHVASQEQGSDSLEIQPNVFRDLHQELSLSSQAFNQKYKHTALMRARRGRYLRNVIVALANSGYSGQNAAELEKLLDDPDPLIKEHAAWALAQWKP